MNRNAANALLKILEEPPRRALLLLVATARAGCCRRSARAAGGFRWRHCRAGGDAAAARALPARPRRVGGRGAGALADGSIGRALDLADAGGLAALPRGPGAAVARRRGSTPRRCMLLPTSWPAPMPRTAYRAVEELLSQLLARSPSRRRAARLGGRDSSPGKVRRCSVSRRAPAGALGRRCATEIGRRFARTDAAQPRPQADDPRRILCDRGRWRGRSGCRRTPPTGSRAGPGPYLRLWRQ